MTARFPQVGVVLVALVWIIIISSAFVPIKFALASCPPLTLLLLRFTFAALLTGLMARWLGYVWPRDRRAWVRLGLLGLLNNLLPALFYTLALRRASAGMAAIMYASNPLLLTMVAPRLLGERLTLVRFAGLVLGFTGVVFVMLTRIGRGRADTPLGVGLCLVGSLALVTGAIFFKRVPPREPLLIVNAAQHLVSAVLLLPAALLFEQQSTVTPNRALYAGLLYLVFGVGIVAALLWFWLLARGEASVAISFSFVGPLIGLLMGALLLNEHFGRREGAGLVAVMVGVALIRRPSGPAQRT